MSDNLPNNDMMFDEREYVVEKPAVMPLTQKVINIFTSPYKVFDNLVDHPKILGALVLVCIFTVLSGLVGLPFMEKSLHNVGMIYEQLGIDNPYTDLRGTAIQSSLLSPLTIILGWAMFSVFLWLSAKIFKIKLSIKKVFSLYAHTLIIQSIVAIFSSILNSYVLNTGVDIFSFAILYPTGNMSSFVYNMLLLINLPALWVNILTGLGLSRMAGKKPVNGLLATFMIYILTILILASAATMPFWALSALQGM